MKRVLVTGATGFIGRHALRPLVERGHDVVAFSINTPAEHVPGVIYIEKNLLDPAETSAVVSEFKPEYLLHFAWYAEHGKFWNSPENFNWVKATLHLLQEFAAHGGKRVVGAGTCAEYDWSSGYCVENETPLDPATTYGQCKNAMQQLQSSLCARYGISSAWGRVFLLFGPNEHPQRLVASVIASLLRGQPARCSHGNQVRDLLYVSDVAEAFVAMLDSKVEGAVNIGSGTPVALKEVIQYIGARLNRPDLVELGAIAAAQDDPPLLTPSIRRITEEVGWTPQYGLNEGLDRTIEWWRHNG